MYLGFITELIWQVCNASLTKLLLLALYWDKVKVSSTVRRNYMTFSFLTDILLHSAFSIFDSCISCFFLRHLKIHIATEIDWYKDGCHLKHILGG